MFPWHHRWTVLAFTLLSQTVIVGIHSFSFPFWVVPWLDEFKVPRSQLMLIITVSVLVSGLLASLCGIALDKYQVRWFVSNRGTALGISAIGMSLGGLLMPPIATTMLAAFGWRETFQLLAVATLFLLIPAAWIVLSKEPEQERPPVAGVTQPTADQVRWTTKQLLRNRDFWIITICFGAFMPLLSVAVVSRFGSASFGWVLGLVITFIQLRLC